MHYLIKQEKCDWCETGTMWVRSADDPTDVEPIPCTNDCTNGYIETRVDADEWLRGRLTELGVKIDPAL